MNTPPAESRTPINRESVKTLAIAVGVREAARQLGLSEDRVRQWSSRDGWFKAPQTPTTVLNRNHVTNVTKTPADAYNQVLRARKAKSRHFLSQFVVNGSKVAARSRSPLADAGKVKDLATVMEKVWPEEKLENDGVMPGLQFYSKQTVIQVNTAKPQP